MQAIVSAACSAAAPETVRLTGEERFNTIKRVFAWENKFRRLLNRYERLCLLHYAFKTLAYTIINLGHFCQR